MSHADATDALNPFKFGQGDPVALQGIALIALADLSRRTPAAVSALRKDGLLATALCDPRPTLKTHAAFVAYQLAPLTTDEINALFLLTTDQDAKTAATALSVFRKPDRLGLNRPQLRLLVSVLERTAARAESLVRSAAAQVVLGLGSSKLRGTLKARRDALHSRLAADPAHSVRRGVGSR